MKTRAKKLIALVMALCLTVTVFPVTDVLASSNAGSQTTINVIQNGSFENVEDGKPADWSVTGTEDGSSIEVQDHGTVLMLNKSSELLGYQNPAEVQVITGLTGSVTYVFKAKVMGTTPETKPCIDFRGNQRTEGTYRTQAYAPKAMVPGVWQEIYYEYTAPSDLTTMDLRLINQGYGILYCDDVVFYAKDDPNQTNLVKNGDFENALTDWSFFAGSPYIEGTHYGTAKLAAAGSKAVQMTGSNTTSDIALSQTVSVTAGGKNQFTAKLFKFADSTPYFKVTYFDAGGNQLGEVQSVDCATAAPGAWATVTGSYDAPSGAVTAAVTIGQTGVGNCLWDDVKLSAPVTGLSNGSFENVENGMPANWNITGTDDGSTIEVQNHGTVLMLNKSSELQAHESPAEVQVISGLTSSVTYVFKAKVMGTENTVKPCVDFRGNQSTASGYRTQAYAPSAMVPGVWQEIYFEYPGPSDLTKMELRLINQGYGILYYDDVEFYAKDDPNQTNLVKNGDFENALTDWSFFAGSPYIEGTHYGTAKIAAAGSKAIQMYGKNTTSDIALSQTVSVTAGEKNQFSAKLFKFADSAPYFKITYFDASGNQLGDVQSVDCATAAAEAWATVTGSYDAPSGAVTATVTIGQTGVGSCLWDDVNLSALVTEATNGSFENVVNGMPADWVASGTGNGDFIEVQNHGAVLMLNKSSDLLAHESPAEVQVISGLTSSVTYVFKAKVMGTETTVKPCVDFRGNQSTASGYRTQAYAPSAMVPGVWQEIYFEYPGPSDLTKMELRLINQGYGILYYDDVEFYAKDDPNQTNLVKNGDFENALTDWSFFASSPYVYGTHYGPANLTLSGTNSVVFAGTKADSKVTLEQTVPVTAGAEFSYYANVMTLNASEGSPYLTLTHYDAAGNVVGEPKVADCTTVGAGVWAIVKGTYRIPAGAVSVTISLGQSGIGTCIWDNVQFIKGELPDDQPKDPATIAAEFRAMLQNEKESATQKVEQEWGKSDVYDAPYAGQTNLVLNGGFEQNEGADSNVAEHWNLKEQFSEYASIGVGEGYNGTDCIKFNVPEKNEAGEPLTQNPFYDQWIKVVGGAEYQVTYKYKLVTGETCYAMPTVKIEMWTDQSLPGARHISEANAWARTPIADGQWQTFTQKIYPAVNVVDMQVLARFLANGVNMGGSTTLYIDDVEVVMTRPPKPLDLSTDAVFYYSDDQAEAGKTGTITTSINTGYFPDKADAQIVLEILDPDGNRIWPADGVSNTFTSENGVVTADFPLAVLSQKEQRYEVVATLYDTDGATIIQRKVQNIYVYDRPTSLSADGVFTKDDGTIFYPEYAYHVSPARSEDYMKLKESGINLVQMGAYTSPEQALADLDKAEAAGIMGFIALYNNMKPAGHNNNIDNTIAIIEAVKDHPALFGYGIMDEVYLNLIDPEDDMQASYRLIRSLDPKHPIMTVEAVSSFYEESAKFVDILCIDPYAAAQSQLVAINTEKAMEAVGYEKPVYVLLEAYRNTHGLFPTRDDIRNNIWQALIQGGSAVGYYSITDSEINDETGQNEVPIWNAKDGGALWQAICDFNTYEKTIAYDHFVFDKSPVYTESAEIGNPYWYSSWKTEAGDYYIVVLSMLDDAEKTQEVSISLNKDGDAAFGSFKATAIGGRINADGVGEVVTGKDNLTLTLNGWEAVLFKVEQREEPTVSVDFVSMSLRGTIVANYYMTIPETIYNDDSAYMEFTKPNGDTQKIYIKNQLVTETIDGKQYYKLSYDVGVSAKEMSEDIVAKLYCNGEFLLENSLSVKDYTNGILEDNSSIYNEVKPLVKAMLHYGAYAQKYFGYNTGKLANEGLDAPNLDSVKKEDLSGYKAVGKGTEKAKFYGASLLLESQTTLRFFFQVDADTTLTVTYGEKALEVKERNGLCYVDVANISAKDLGNAITLKISDGTSETSVSASPMTYCYNILAATEGTYEENIVNLAKTLYLYYQEANAYLNQKEANQ